MKYKSELLNEILEQRGHEVPNLHYQSECIETWIEENKGAYPKLCDYESEWLNYINKNPIGEFPYETVTTNHTATVNHVVPYAYQSAILKGNTLLVDELGNECEIPNSPKITMGAWINTDTGVDTASVTSFNTGFLKCPTVPFIVKGNNKYKRIVFYDKNKTFISGINAMVENNSNVTIGSTQIPSNAFYLRISASIVTDNVSYTPDTKLLIEDVSGNNLYSTQLVSVKLPVLTTTGKNLIGRYEKVVYRSGREQGGATLDNDGNFTYVGAPGNRPCLIYKNNPNTSVTVSANVSLHGLDIYEYSDIPNFTREDEPSMLTEYHYSGKQKSITRTTSKEVKYIGISFYNDSDNTGYTNLQLEYGLQATEHEPYKTNILTVNEDVTLRGIGNVQDTLDLLTGEVVQNIDEVVLDGSDDEQYIKSILSLNNTVTFGIILPNYKARGASINNKFVTTATDNNDYEHSYGSIFNNKNLVWFFINKTKLSSCDINGFKQWLSQNPITLQYELTSQPIKTVDLTIVNQYGDSLSKIKPIEGTMHIEVSGTPISPTAVLEIPVEAIAQNLNSFIKEG